MTRQRVLLDRLCRVSYIGGCVLLVGCPGRLEPLVPMALAPGDRTAATAWTASMLPRRQMAIRFHWKYRDAGQTYAGRGQARIAPPDSLRFDYATPLNLGKGAAVVIGDSAVWAEPEKNFRALLGTARMLWTVIGAVRPPKPGEVVLGLKQPPITIWRFVAGADTLDYRATEGAARLLEAEWRQDGKVVARSRTEFDDHAMPAKARIDFPEAPARFELTVVAVDTTAVIAPELWRNRR